MNEEQDRDSVPSANGVDHIVGLLRSSRDEVLRDWLDRVRDNRAVEAGQTLSDPLLLDHVPQLYDAMLDRMEVNRAREDSEQLAAIHGFTRRVTGYDVIETVIELLMFRRAIWAQLTAMDAPIEGAYEAMERIDGMVDRAVITSLKAFLDPAARMLIRQVADADHAVDVLGVGQVAATVGPRPASD
jgi:hypothetical protein